MQISRHKVVTLDYVLRVEGNEIDRSESEHPLAYIHGIGQFLPGLEQALDNKNIGDQLSVKLSPEDAFGERDDELVRVIPRAELDFADRLELDMQFEMEDEDGEPMVVTVTDLNDQEVTLDGNHPLAGMTLEFDVTVRAVRDAAPDELTHGHVHGPGGHHHH